MSTRKTMTDESQKSASTTTSATPITPFLIIIITSIAVYFNALFNAFVYDDIYQVLQNPWIRDIKYIPTIFSQSVWAFSIDTTASNYYRPLMHLIYMFNYHVFGLNAWGFHLVNVLIHSGVSVLVYITARQLLGRSHPATVRAYFAPPFIAALLFATHPVHTEAVTWVAGVPELAFTLCFLLSLYFFTQSEEGSRSSTILSLVSFAFALLFKETALTLPIILVAFDYAYKKSFPRPVLDYFKRYVPYAIISALYLIVRYSVLGGLAPAAKDFELSTYQYTLSSISVFAQYIEKLVLPIHLNAYHVFHPTVSILEGEGLLSLAITAAVIILFAVTLKKNKPVFFSLCLVIAPLLPTFYILGSSEVAFSERYLYLPSVGYVLMVALFVEKIGVHTRERAISLGVLLALVIGLYSLGTVSRNTIWKDEYRFWMDAASKSPDGATPHEALGVVLFNNGRVEEAIKEFERALELKPNFPAAHIDLGTAYGKKGMIDKAAEHFMRALQMTPSWEAYRGLGTAYLTMGRFDDAIEQLQYALKVNPELADAHYSLGLAYSRKGLIDNAIEHYEAAVRISPTAAAYINLGVAYESEGMTDKAIEQYLAATKLQPDNAKAYNNLGTAYAKRGLIDKAVENLEYAVKLDPSIKGFRENLEKAYTMQNSVHKSGNKAQERR